MAYSVKELYFTLQGEGLHTGRKAVFLRFAGCNLWSGLAADRAASLCDFCDTDFVGIDGPGGGRYASPDALADAALAVWNSAIEAADERPFVVCTGGEPLLQLNAALIQELSERDFEIAVETNGTLPAPAGIDWVTCSPKHSADELKLTAGDELKLVFPQPRLDPQQYLSLPFRHFYLQPMDGPNLESNRQQAVEYCQAHPDWKISLQTHKALGIR